MILYRLRHFFKDSVPRSVPELPQHFRDRVHGGLHVFLGHGQGRFKAEDIPSVGSRGAKDTPFQELN